MYPFFKMKYLLVSCFSLLLISLTSCNKEKKLEYTTWEGTCVQPVYLGDLYYADAEHDITISFKEEYVNVDIKTKLDVFLYGYEIELSSLFSGGFFCEKSNHVTVVINGVESSGTFSKYEMTLEMAIPDAYLNNTWVALRKKP